MPKLSAVIITLNEERNIGRCIDSLIAVADDIVVIDSGSTDNTKDICKEKGARFIFNKWAGYIEQKNFANGLAEYPHILSIDADEALSGQLRDSILKVKDNFVADGYEMNRLTNYCGKWIRHGGWYPDRKLRLFHRDKFEWGGERIHEMMIMKESNAHVESLAGDLLHYSYYNISEHIAQANHFTNMTAGLAVEKGKSSGIFKIIFSPFVKFIKDYIIKLGFLDGYYGYVVCRISAQATFMKYAKIRQIRKGKKA
ncbi:MAG: glycosyltransferase family 2 protein [Bacteroidales bacterium]|nr:glycosyltransferase family 2 protein [Bacteroidales bacterium]